MKRIFMALVMAGAAVIACAQEPNQAVYIVTHVDTFGGEKANEAAKMLQQYVADCKKDPAAIRIELVREPSRLNHFALIEIWKSRKDFEAHLDKPYTVQFRTKIQPILGGPFDERLHVQMP